VPVLNLDGEGVPSPETPSTAPFVRSHNTVLFDKTWVGELPPDVKGLLGGLYETKRVAPDDDWLDLVNDLRGLVRARYSAGGYDNQGAPTLSAGVLVKSSSDG
jgi:hypothetical protein